MNYAFDWERIVAISLLGCAVAATLWAMVETVRDHWRFDARMRELGKRAESAKRRIAYHRMAIRLYAEGRGAELDGNTPPEDTVDASNKD